MTLNVDPSSLYLFKIGNSVVFDDGTTSIIVGVVINDNVTAISSSQGFSNYSENFQEGIDLVSIDLYLSQPTTSLTTSVKIVSKTSVTNSTTPVSNNKTPLSDTDLTNISNEIEKKILNDLQRNETNLVNDIINGVNAKLSPVPSDCTAYQTESKYAIQQVGSSSNPTMREKTDNVFQSGNMYVELPDKYLNNDRPDQLPSISESKTKVIFPNTESSSDQYSYYGALQTKGSDFAGSNSISETNKMLGRLDYAPPPLPPNFDFTYYGPFRSKATDNVKPVNALQGPNMNKYSEKIMDNPSNPIDLYSQYGALVPKNNFYNKLQ